MVTLLRKGLCGHASATGIREENGIPAPHIDVEVSTLSIIVGCVAFMIASPGNTLDC